MSTTTTGADPGRTPRRARFARPFQRRPDTTAAGRRAPAPAGVQRLPLVLDNAGQERLLRDSHRRGVKVAKTGGLDPWVLVGGDRLPYFAWLASVRDLVRARVAEEAAEEDARQRVLEANAVSAAAGAAAEAERLERQLAENQDWLETNREQLDRLAARAVRWERFRDGVRERLEERWLRARFGDLDLDEGRAGHGDGDGDGRRPGRRHRDDHPQGPGHPHGDAPDTDTGDGKDEAGPAPGAEPDDDDWQSLDPAPAATAAAGHRARREPAGTRPADPFAGIRPQSDAARWEGLPVRPGLPRWMVWSLLLVIAAVEVPIYWIAFQPFHGAGSTESDALSATLAISAAVVMVIIPHLAGRALRSRPATASPKGVNLPAVALLAVWGFSTWALGHLRSKLVFRKREAQKLPAELDGIAGMEDLRPTRTLVDSLHLEPTTVTWMFVSLLVLSGGIGLLLGLLREHPYLDSYRSHLELRARLERAREAATAAAERARALETTAADRQTLRREATAARQRSTTELYEAAAYRFLQGVIEGAADPAVTESAMRLARDWPILPLPRAAA
ncbi:hypothetical protein DEJ50_04805 [Streptomyces venezuelae]|uniref:Uncharacterized protein n=1 Tax=Streptomyces venezuelae TaxID=54571 RepID=A0A5P2CWH4_STRVZ|nr:hypothetical protein [Streptomyces venezuelae]QES47252.1 hypothetical protein DEJ50_04805 [Streptomyces venezuelae]